MINRNSGAAVETIDNTTQWFVETCAKCSVQWAMPAGAVSALRHSHETFWSPRCCASWHYAAKPERDELLREIERYFELHLSHKRGHDLHHEILSRIRATLARTEAADAE